MRSRPFIYPDPTREEMAAYLLGRHGEAYYRYWKRVRCSVWAYYQYLPHFFRDRAGLDRREVKPTFPRRVGWLDRVRRRNLKTKTKEAGR